MKRYQVTFVFDYTTITTFIEASDDGGAEDVARIFVYQDLLVPKGIIDSANEVLVEELEMV